MLTYVDANQVDLLESGSAFFTALKQAIAKARHEVHLETYIFQNDTIGAGIAAMLGAAAQRGVVVRLLVDGFGSREFVGSSLFTSLWRAGVAIRVYRKELRRLSLNRGRLRRLHRKLAVIDGCQAFVGGINIIDDAVSDGLDYPRLDYAVSVQGPLVLNIHAVVQRMWYLVSLAQLQRVGTRFFQPQPHLSKGDVSAAFVIRDNFRHRRDIEDAYLRQLAWSRKEVIIACAYFFPGRRFRHALRDATARGVRITLLLQGLSDHPVLAYATRALYPSLQSYGIELYEYQRSYLHAKVAVFDRRWATVGSSNIDPFSLLMAREANVFVDNLDFAGQLHGSLVQAMRQGALYWCERQRQRWPLHKRILSWLAYQLARLAMGLAGVDDRS